MRDFLLKIKIFWLMLNVRSVFKIWRKDVWEHDLDDYYCCDGGLLYGNLCGCHGSTIREVFLAEVDDA